MPLYEYHCNECSEEFEKMVRFSEAKDCQTCPVCQSDDTRKKISAISSFGSLLSETSVSSNNDCTPRGGFS